MGRLMFVSVRDEDGRPVSVALHLLQRNPVTGEVRTVNTLLTLKSEAPVVLCDSDDINDPDYVKVLTTYGIFWINRLWLSEDPPLP